MKEFWLKEIDSTSTESRRLWEQGATAGEAFCVVAERQQQGRGRLSRSWDSLEGNLFVTFCYPLSSRQAHQAFPFFSLAAGLSVADVVKGFDLSVACKWPNDILCLNGKVAGILLEVVRHKTLGEALLIGIGVNLVQSPLIMEKSYQAFSLLEALAIEHGDEVMSLRQHDMTPSYIMSQLTPILMTHLEMCWTSPLDIKTRWESYAKPFLGRFLVVLSDGVEKRGVFEGVSPQGFLLLRREGSAWVEEIVSGEVSFLENFSPTCFL